MCHCIINSGLKTYAFGDLVPKALDRAAKMLKKSIDVVNVPHPSKTSTFLHQMLECSNL
jgi:hypothetical protein